MIGTQTSHEQPEGRVEPSNLILLSERLTTLFRHLGIPRNLPPENFWNRAQSLSEEKLIEFQLNLQKYVDQCETSITLELPALNDLRLTWYAIRKLNLRGPDDLFSALSEKDCIEIYDKNGVQMYRNFEFFRFCSYSVEELLTAPWYELFARDPEIQKNMQLEAQRVMTISREHFRSSIPKHLTDETNPGRRRVEIEFLTISPLFGPTGKTEAFLSSSQISYVGRFK
jgi:hypothetical protein